MSADSIFSGSLADPDDSTIANRRQAEGAARQWPATIGHFRIIRLLGEGGMATVYEAEQEQRAAGWL